MRRAEERTARGVRDERGYVTAETAVVVPSLVFLVAALLWGLMAGVAQVQCVDGARAGARAAARGESAESVARAVRSAAPDGASVEVTRHDDLVQVRVRARVDGPGTVDHARSGERRGAGGVDCGGGAMKRVALVWPAARAKRRGAARTDRGSATVWAALSAWALWCVRRAAGARTGRLRPPPGGRGRGSVGLGRCGRALEGEPRLRRRPTGGRGARARLVRCDVSGEIADLTAQVRLGPYAPAYGRAPGRPARGPTAGAGGPTSWRRRAVEPSRPDRSAPCAGGRCRCRTWATGCRTGSRASHSQEAMASRVAREPVARRVRKPRSAKPAPPGWPS